MKIGVMILTQRVTIPAGMVKTRMRETDITVGMTIVHLLIE